MIPDTHNTSHEGVVTSAWRRYDTSHVGAMILVFIWHDTAFQDAMIWACRRRDTHYTDHEGVMILTFMRHDSIAMKVRWPRTRDSWLSYTWHIRNDTYDTSIVKVPSWGMTLTVKVPWYWPSAVITRKANSLQLCGNCTPPSFGTSV